MFPKIVISGIPKMDGEHNEKPGYIIPMDLGVFPLFLG